MQIKIYQINTERDKHGLKFKDLSFAGRPDPAIYDEVFSGNVDCVDLEEVFRKFNLEGHPLHRGHSLSVSDVVAVEGDVPELVGRTIIADTHIGRHIPTVDTGIYYCDSIGFKRIEFDGSLTKKPDDLMKIVYVEPNRHPFISEIAKSLDAEQKAVGGLIEAVYNNDETALICNEEAKLIGMKGNRRLDNGHSIIAGPFFVVGLTSDDFRSLTEEEANKYMDRFAQPENISKEEVESDMGFTLMMF